MTNTAAAEVPKAKMMNGTGSYNSYMVFARRGDTLLGIRPNVIADGSRMGVPNTTYLGARLRSAPGGDKLFSEEDAAKAAESNVVGIGSKNTLDLVESWPQVTFEKHTSGDRASTQIGIFLRGSVGADAKVLVEAMENKKLAKKFAAYLSDLAGPENLTMSQRDIADWLQAFYQPKVDNIAKAAEAQAAVQEKVNASVGNFGMQAAMLKEVYEAGKSQEGTFEAAEDLPEDVMDDEEDENGGGSQDD